ncbi:MAG: hypothetical protein J2O48_10135, partial [Solirubrobacterales bacterium]|nr:hypothetical protein [Solirubrobacterales bacterium]
ARSEEQVAHAVADLDPTRASLFFQGFIAGEVRNYCAVVAPGGQVVHEAVVRQHGRRAGVRPEREIVDDPELLAYGRAICAELAVAGPVDLEAIHDGERYRLVDLNPRPWNSMISMHAAGFDFDGSYAYVIGVSSVPPSDVAVPGGTRFLVFPDVVDGEMGEGHPLAALGRFLLVGARFLRWAGPRYLLQLIVYRIWLRVEGASSSAGLPDELG